MKLESKLRVSLAKRADHIVLRRELAQLGSKSQLTEAINRLITAGRLVRLSPGVYAKAIVDSQGKLELSAPPDVLAREIQAKTGHAASVPQVESKLSRPAFQQKFASDLPRAGGASPFAERRRKRRTGTFELPDDVTQLPNKGVGAFVARLAKAHGVVYTRTQLDDFAEAVTRLAGDDERLDATGKLLATLRKQSVINGPQLARLMTNHMREQQDAVRPVRGLPHRRLP
ncbi:type IV toxin-antitoxin system AbiEi family antitoxin domain-containing protein [Ramlibacter sp. WS9]|uniref:type IV toxin-antitoxin system AbiEi family antitoxin domain-containing protein n=1 Tax=Ramlibacter sp. WS9 TaxID=1882741 RepID=UPI001142E0E7|nr:type IV toxin-antitoxin system AbiEi family antitoxin domain-containing protein [Ramlibacter sp. WS9]ROZ79202.1 hypothetical protein EEB15_05915 [Ramlibacter sp. WS9]